MTLRHGPTTARVAAETLAFRGAAIPLSFVTTVVTTRFLLPTGRAAFILGLLAVTLPATLLRLGGGVTYHIGRDHDSAPTVLRRGIFLSLVLGAVGAVVILCLELVLASPGYRIVAVAPVALPAMLVTDVAGGALLALGRVRTINIVALILPAGVLISMVVLVVGFSLGVTGAVLGWAGAQTAVALGAIFATRGIWRGTGNGVTAPPPRGSATTFTTVRNRSLLSFGVKFGLVNFISLLNYRIELILLQLYYGLHTVGIYTLAVSLSEFVWLSSSALATALTPRALAADEERAPQLIARGVRHAFLAAAVLATGLGVAGLVMIPVVFGHVFQPSIVPLLLLLPGAVAFAPAATLALYFSLRLGRLRTTTTLTVTSIALTSLTAVILVPPFGAEGAAIASSVGYIGSTAAALLWFNRLTRSRLRDVLPRRADPLDYKRIAAEWLSR
jgi:O-antigen/teichoic acid export membrane protein